jgi:hypothetical protein
MRMFGDADCPNPKKVLVLQRLEIGTYYQGICITDHLFNHLKLIIRRIISPTLERNLAIRWSKNRHKSYKIPSLLHCITSRSGFSWNHWLRWLGKDMVLVIFFSNSRPWLTISRPWLTNSRPWLTISRPWLRKTSHVVPGEHLVPGPFLWGILHCKFANIPRMDSKCANIADHVWIVEEVVNLSAEVGSNDGCDWLL